MLAALRAATQQKVLSVLCCRFSEVARAVQQLPAQLYVSEQDLQAKNAHELKV